MTPVGYHWFGHVLISCHHRSVTEMCANIVPVGNTRTLQQIDRDTEAGHNIDLFDARRLRPYDPTEPLDIPLLATGIWFKTTGYHHAGPCAQWCQWQESADNDTARTYLHTMKRQYNLDLPTPRWMFGVSY